MEGLINLVRGDLTPLNRMTLSALVVIDVHARDVITNMVAENVSDENDFEWLAQMRFFFGCRLCITLCTTCCVQRISCVDTTGRMTL